MDRPSGIFNDFVPDRIICDIVVKRNLSRRGAYEGASESANMEQGGQQPTTAGERMDGSGEEREDVKEACANASPHALSCLSLHSARLHPSTVLISSIFALQV